tara:strand:+ start:52 stop:1404 length:1353 start_codon:yes stop_codon:yes gene_type:complete
MSTKFNPKIRSSIVSVGEVFDAIKDPEGFVRPTTRIENLKRALDRGTDSTVFRSMGFNNLFETFEKAGISKATINKFKNIPDITDYLDKDMNLSDSKLNKYNKDLKKFRLDAFKGLSPKQLRVVESSGFLSQFAKDQRLKILDSGKKFNQKILNKTLDDMFDFTFKDLDTAVGVKNPQIQDKKITKAMDKVDANEKIKPAQKLNIKFGLSQVDKLVKMGNTPAARKLLTAILTLAPKGLFGMDLLIPTTMGSGELPEEGTPEYEQLMKDMGKNQGGMMDINFMTRPMGYKDGTRDGTLVGDKKEEIPVREIVRDEPEGIMGTIKSFVSKKEFGTIENPLPLSMVFEPGVSQKTLIDEGAFISTPDGITFKATPKMFDKYLGTKYVENNTFGERDDVEVEFKPKYITSAEKSFVEPGGVFDQVQTPRAEGRFTEMNQGGIMDINQLTKRIR